MQKHGPLGAQCGKRCQNGAKMEANGSPKCHKNRGFEKKCRKWFGPIIYYIYSLPAPCKNLTFSYLEITKMQVFFACCLGCRPGAAKWRPRGRKMARVGSPGIPKGAKWSPNASQNTPKNHPKSAPLSRSASKGAPRVPRVPHRAQNTSIFGCSPDRRYPKEGERSTLPSRSLLHPTHSLRR